MTIPDVSSHSQARYTRRKQGGENALCCRRENPQRGLTSSHKGENIPIVVSKHSVFFFPQHLLQMCCGVSVSAIAGYLISRLAGCPDLAAESQCEAHCILIGQQPCAVHTGAISHAASFMLSLELVLLLDQLI